MDSTIIINKGIDTGTFATNGLLPEEVAEQFLDMTYEATPLGKLIRHEKHRAKSGKINKIGIDSRIIRAKDEGVDDGYRAGVKTESISYECKAIKLPWQMSGETLRENIEQAKLEGKITNLMTSQYGRDTEDLGINGDESTANTDPDYDFLKLNNGFKKLITTGGHIYDAYTAANGVMSIQTFYDAAITMPSKYLTPELRWLMSPRRALKWQEVLMQAGIQAGGFAPNNVFTSPANIPIVEVPRLDDSTVLLVNPQNLIQVNTYDIMLKKDATSKEAIYKDMIYYIMHNDVDFVIEELDATLAITNLNPVLSA